ncbi:hypothetical protein TNCV_962761 [Trichonephila clavipes]|nr:hypothetical protein TNCV_962761 [Trichonephila clavipes]
MMSNSVKFLTTIMAMFVWGHVLHSVNSFKVKHVFLSFFHLNFWGCGSPMVKVSDHARHVMSSRPVPPKDPPCRAAMHVPAQVSSTSLDYGSKLRGPSPKALV